MSRPSWNHLQIVASGGTTADPVPQGLLAGRTPGFFGLEATSWSRSRDHSRLSTMLADLWGLLPAAVSCPACGALFTLKVFPHISGGFMAL